MAARHRFLLNGREHRVAVDQTAGRVSITIDDGPPVVVDVASAGVPGVASIVVDGRMQRAYVVSSGAGFEVIVEGRRFIVAPATGGGRQRAAVGAKDRIGEVTSPLAGVVIDVRVAVGEAVKVGQTLVVVEAMKMQNEIQAPHAGTVTAVHCTKGGRVEQGALLVEYDPAAT